VVHPHNLTVHLAHPDHPVQPEVMVNPVNPAVLDNPEAPDNPLAAQAKPLAVLAAHPDQLALLDKMDNLEAPVEMVIPDNPDMVVALDLPVQLVLPEMLVNPVEMVNPVALDNLEATELVDRDAPDPKDHLVNPVEMDNPEVQDNPEVTDNPVLPANPVQMGNPAVPVNPVVLELLATLVSQARMPPIAHAQHALKALVSALTAHLKAIVVVLSKPK